MRQLWRARTPVREAQGLPFFVVPAAGKDIDSGTAIEINPDPSNFFNFHKTKTKFH
jgi:hypothetical protein